MWRPRLPQRDPDRWVVLTLIVGLPVIAMIAQGAPILPTLLVGVVFGVIITLIRS